ncbi:MAG: hypothetical protein APR63_07545 [Desulfuromonas sp. SDB]|nr:MAG: hypothetical protein APR63_07545 [Desulfuromonas sp. SDB]
MNKWICGNWKMNGTLAESISWAKQAEYTAEQNREVMVGIAPSLFSINAIISEVKPQSLLVGAQNCHWSESGAFTGETSPASLQQIGCHFVILGHSERRHIFGETDQLISRRIKGALEHNLNVILCVGETLNQREQNKTIEIIKNQLANSLKDIKIDDFNNITIAYEPVWAIGTGRVASPDQAQEVHSYIREYLGSISPQLKEKVRILYGGSVKPENWSDLNQMNDIDGALVGGASLIPDKFRSIVEISNKGE